MNHKQTGPAARPILESTARVLLLAVAVLALPPQSTAQQAQLAPKPIPVPNLGVWEDTVPWPIVAVHMLHHPNGKMLIWALTKDAQSQRSQIMLGTWACGDAQVRIIRRFDDPASLQKQQNRDSFPYTWTTLPSGGFLVGT